MFNELLLFVSNTLQVLPQNGQIGIKYFKDYNFPTYSTWVPPNCGHVDRANGKIAFLLLNNIYYFI
jgi:hypothetical protein